ncbi:MAG TPA: holo-[acyl-carrier-protein] synthase [Cyanobacteria bacterium UBA8530]|nr:holo-[acyl-carrier-protein] synthase [Cyanobacteria bacterium UBA8530]
MRIKGVGISLIDAERFRALRLRFGERLLKRFFSGQELEYCFSHRFPDPHLAGRMAAKIAFRKALGEIISFSNLEVRRGEQGRPEIRLISGRPAQKDETFFLSISHSGRLAIAHVLIEGE